MLFLPSWYFLLHKKGKKIRILYNNRFLYSYALVANAICQGVGYIPITFLILFIRYRIRSTSGMSLLLMCVFWRRSSDEIRKNSRFSSHKPIFMCIFLFLLHVSFYFLSYCIVHLPNSVEHKCMITNPRLSFRLGIIRFCMAFADGCRFQMNEKHETKKQKVIILSRNEGETNHISTI